MSFELKYNKLLNLVPNQDLTNFLGLKNLNDEKYSIKFIRTFDYLYLTFDFIKLKIEKLVSLLKH